ncbi:MAG: Fic family protein [Turneriella sp.]|nr:Fic family protein [Turneriella sp.]
MPLIALNRIEKTELFDLFFQLKKQSEVHPKAKEEIMTAIRCLKAIHSNAIEDRSIDRVFLQILLHNAGIANKADISAKYQHAQMEILGQQKMLIELEKKAYAGEDMSISMLLAMHRTVFQESWPDRAGVFRTHEVQISAMQHRPPHASKISETLHQQFANINAELVALKTVSAENFWDIFSLSARLHYLVAGVHPFEDGNGRVARASGDYIYLRFGMFFDVITTDYRDKYLDALEESDFMDVTPLANFLQYSYLETLKRISTFFHLLS